MWIYEAGGEVVTPNHAKEGKPPLAQRIQTPQFSDEIRAPAPPVYGTSNTAHTKAKPRARAAPDTPPRAEKAINSDVARKTELSSDFTSRQKFKPNRLFFLSLLYIGGTLFAGFFYPFLRDSELQYIDYYLAHKIALCSDGSAVSLFFSSALAALGCITAIFLSGLSAFGVPLIIAFTVLKGLGSGVLFLALLFSDGIVGVYGYVALFAISEAFCAACFCLLSVRASKNAHALFLYNFRQKGKHEGGALTVKENHFTALCGQYLLYAMLLCAFCALSTMLTQVFLLLIK